MGSGFKNIIICVVSIVAVMASCLPEPIEVRDISQPPKIVVSSQVNGKVINILLTKSISALDASDDSDWLAVLAETVITDATVTISVNNQSYQLEFNSGVYTTSDVPLRGGGIYHLQVESPTYGTVTATTIMKREVKFTTVTADMQYNRNDTVAHITYAFNDPAGPNWYLVMGQHVTGRNPKETMLNPRVTIEQLADSGTTVGSRYGDFNVRFDNVKPFDTVTAILSNVSEDYYDYISIRQDFGIGIAAALGEPLNYPSNVEGGLGFFNLYIPDVHTFILKP